MTGKMAEEKKINIRKEKERFLADPLLSAWNDLLVKIHMAVIPTYVISGNKIIERNYDPETLALIESIEKKRKEYTEAKYGISEGDRKWQ